QLRHRLVQCQSHFVDFPVQPAQTEGGVKNKHFDHFSETAFREDRLWGRHARCLRDQGGPFLWNLSPNRHFKGGSARRLLAAVPVFAGRGRCFRRRGIFFTCNAGARRASRGRRPGGGPGPSARRCDEATVRRRNGATAWRQGAVITMKRSEVVGMDEALKEKAKALAQAVKESDVFRAWQQ